MRDERRETIYEKWETRDKTRDESWEMIDERWGETRGEK